jgi:hypothetical protein
MTDIILYLILIAIGGTGINISFQLCEISRLLSVIADIMKENKNDQS